MTIRSTLLLLLLQVPLFMSARIVKSRVEVFYVEEVADGHSFIYRIDAIDGKKRESWSIDGASVDLAEYSQELLQADMREHHRERDCERMKQLAKIEEEQELRVALSRKLVRLTLADVDRNYEKIANVRLYAYRVYDHTTFESAEQLQNFVEERCVQVRELLEEPSYQVDGQQLEAIARELGQYPERLEQMYRATIKNAIATCDDTKLLKELLTLI